MWLNECKKWSLLRFYQNPNIFVPINMSIQAVTIMKLNAWWSLTLNFLWSLGTTSSWDIESKSMVELNVVTSLMYSLSVVWVYKLLEL